MSPSTETPRKKSLQELAILMSGLVAGALLQAGTSWMSDVRAARRDDATWLRDKQWTAYSDYAQAIAHARNTIRDLTVSWRQTEEDGAWSDRESELERMIHAVTDAVVRVEEVALTAALPTKPDKLATLQSLNDDFVEAVLGIRGALLLPSSEDRSAEIDAWVQRVSFLTHEIRRFAARELGYRTDAPRPTPPRPAGKNSADKRTP